MTQDPAQVGVSAARQRLWTRDFLLAAAVTFFLAFVFYLLMTTMTLYAAQRFGANDALGGLTSSAFVLGALIARLFAGSLVDLIGRKRLLLISLAVFAVTSGSYLLVDSLWGLLVVRAVHGVAFAFASTAAMALAQSMIPPQRRAEGTGHFGLGATLATAVGPLAAQILMKEGGYTALFITVTAASVLGMTVALFLRAPAEARPAGEKTRLLWFHPRNMLHPAILPVATFMLLMAVSYSGVLAFLNSYTGQQGLESGAGLFFLAYAAALFASRLFAGKIQDRRGDNLIVYAATASFALGLLLLATVSTDVGLALSGTFAGLGFGTLMSALQAIAVSRVPAHRLGAGISTHYFMVDLGMGVGPILLGVILHFTGYQPMYLMLAGAVLLSTIHYYLVHGRTQEKRLPTGLVHPRTEQQPAPKAP